jgi:hypothetical protein
MLSGHTVRVHEQIRLLQDHASIHGHMHLRTQAQTNAPNMQLAVVMHLIIDESACMMARKKERNIYANYMCLL